MLTRHGRRFPEARGFPADLQCNGIYSAHQTLASQNGAVSVSRQQLIAADEATLFAVSTIIPHGYSGIHLITCREYGTGNVHGTYHCFERNVVLSCGCGASHNTYTRHQALDRRLAAAHFYAAVIIAEVTCYELGTVALQACNVSM